MPGLLASTLNDVIIESKCGGDYQKLLNAVAKGPLKSNKKYGEAEIKVFVDAMMHEPADLSGHVGPHEYM